MPAEDRLGEGEAQAAVEPGELLGGAVAVGAAGQVLAQIGVHRGAGPPEGHVQQPRIAPALLPQGQFAVRLEAFLAQPFAGPAQHGAGVLLVQAEQRGGYGEGFGLDLGVPQHGARGVGQPPEGAGKQGPAGCRAQQGPGVGPQGGVEEFPALVGAPLGRDTADGDQHLGPPGGTGAGLAEAVAEQPGEGGGGQHARGARPVGAQPGVGQGRRPVPVEERADGMRRR
ncbi:hypothetical protein ACH4NF_03155 [Streptomyces sp. NPDC017248]|uniref:hypothetical protein n=1 Tax=unclassified Streptomyces TaxID=2593676 RepID=UPI0037AFA046